MTFWLYDTDNLSAKELLKKYPAIKKYSTGENSVRYYDDSVETIKVQLDKIEDLVSLREDIGKELVIVGDEWIEIYDNWRE